MSTLVTTNLKHAGSASPNIVLNSDGDVTFGGDVTLGTSVLAAPTGNAPSYTCRAWVNFRGTSTVLIRASGNVSSITDNGAGEYTVNFTTAMPDTNYSWSGNCSNTAVGSSTFAVVEYSSGGKTTSSLRVYTSTSNSTTDSPNVHINIFR